MSKFKIGDYVTPKSQYIGSGKVYRIARYDDVSQKCDLVVPNFREQAGIDEKVIECEWYSHELIFYDSEENNMKNILDIYKERKKDMLESYRKQEIDMVIAEDEIQKIIAEANRLIQETEPTSVFPVILSEIYTTETLEKEKQIDAEYKQKLTELDELIEEVEGYFAMTTDFTERKEILRNYDIIDKKGKLII